MLQETTDNYIMHLSKKVALVFGFSFLLTLFAGCSNPQKEIQQDRGPSNVGANQPIWQQSLNKYLACYIDDQKLSKANGPCPLSSTPNLNIENCSTYFDQSLIPALTIDALILTPKNFSEKSHYRENHLNGTTILAKLRTELDLKVKSIIGKTSVPQATSCLKSYSNYLQTTRRLEDQLGEIELWLRAGISQPARYVDRKKQRAQLTETTIRQSNPGGRRQVQELVFLKSAFIKNSIPHSLPYQEIFKFQEGDLLLFTSRTLTGLSLHYLNGGESSFDTVGLLVEDPLLKANIQGLYGRKPPLEQIKKYYYVYFSSPQTGLTRVSLSDLESSVSRMKWLRWYDSSIKGLQFAAEFANQAKKLYFESKNKNYDFTGATQDSAPYSSSEFVNSAIHKASNAMSYYDLLSQQKGKKFEFPLFDLRQENATQFSQYFKKPESPTILSLEIDPHFNPISEWRAFAALESSSLTESLLKTVFGWMKPPFKYNFAVENASGSLPPVDIQITINDRKLPTSELSIEKLSETALNQNQKRLISLIFNKLLHLNRALEIESIKTWQQRHRRFTPSESYTLFNDLRLKEQSEWNKRFSNKPLEINDDLYSSDFPIHLYFYPNP